MATFMNRMSAESIGHIDNSLVESLVELYKKLDISTVRHQYRVAKIAVLIAKLMNLPKEQTQLIQMASLLHDIGKLTIPVSLLNKATALDKDELKIIKKHPLSGYTILLSIGCPENIAEIILQHHERLDGSGYPSGMKCDSITFEAQIIAIADVVDAMRYGRPYNHIHDCTEIRTELLKNGGILYNSEVVSVAENNMDLINLLYKMRNHRRYTTSELNR